MRRAFVVVLLVALFGSGCATIVHGPRQEVEVLSEPDGATVYVNDTEHGTTPTVLTLDRNRRYVVRVEQEGFLPETQLLTRGASTWAIIGAIFTGPFVVVDWISGSLYELKPGQLYFDLGAPGPSEEEADGRPAPR